MYRDVFGYFVRGSVGGVFSNTLNIQSFDAYPYVVGWIYSAADGVHI
jgi:hypothetical protein